MSPNSLTRYEENADKDKGMHNESRKTNTQHISKWRSTLHPDKS